MLFDSVHPERVHGFNEIINVLLGKGHGILIVIKNKEMNSGVQEKYDSLYFFPDMFAGIEEAIDILKNTESNKEWQEKKEHLLAGKTIRLNECTNLLLPLLKGINFCRRGCG